MKTAMQELMELNDFLKIMGVTIEWDKYLEKEKEHIIDAWDKRGSTIVPRYFLEENINGEDYYNDTYNQNK